jgi:sugar lactone lactonase YvrE
VVAFPADGEAAFQRLHASNGIRLSDDQSLVFVSDLSGKWVWSFQVQADGALANGEPYYRMETPDESSESAASGVTTDHHGLLYVATRLGMQVCDQQGRVVAILNPPGYPETAQPGVSGIAFGGADQHYLYAAVGNKVFRRHVVKRPE